MSRATEEVHALVGEVGQIPMGQVPYVGIVPDTYLPPLRFEGGAGHDSLAAAVGFRSEIAIVLATLNENYGAEIWDLWIKSSTAGGSVELVRPTVALSGFTNQPFISGDVGAGRGVLRLQTKNSAAATSADTIMKLALHPTASVPTYVPGLFRLRRSVGSVFSNAILVRPVADNREIACWFRYRELEKRKL